MVLKTLFWIFTGIILYTYLGYTIILACVAYIKKHRKSPSSQNTKYEPYVSILIPAYNEAVSIVAKMENTLSLDYPKEKLKIVWITDGSDDETLNILKQYDSISVFHEPQRRGKIHAMNRGMKLINTPIVVFTDANTMLNRYAVRAIVKYFADPLVGCVAGEKRIKLNDVEKAVEAGEGLYWQYESLVKKLESDSGSAVCAAGELFALRTELYENVDEDTILDDFVISLKIASRGYKIKYAPDAHGTETASISVKEELKRKIRIACGGWQTLFKMPHLLNVFRFGFLSLKYISHKVFRWTLVPFSFFISFILNLVIILSAPLFSNIYWYLFVFQLLFYLAVTVGSIFHDIRIRAKVLFVPYYIFIMNYAVILGMFRYFSGHYSVNWEKAKRS
jgi:cellulose synthase/poly-beta-1,6-N-acetylglucosamine synthase-like glycosyltransferase